MPDCRENIVSEDYADFILEYGEREEQILRQYESYCVQSISNRFAALYAPLSEVEPGLVKSYSYSAIPKLYGLMDTTAVAATGALRLQRQNGFNLTGKDVIVGFIDTGIDYTNAAFKNATGQTRIVGIWDQTDQTVDIPNGLRFGSEYTQGDINRALTSDVPYEVVPHRDENGHGTFMAGVACGTPDVQNDFTGAASDSLIAVVKLKPAKQYLRDFYIIEGDDIAYQENDIMLAVAYLENLSLNLDKPLVVVLGLGTSNGDHSGGSPLSQMLNDQGEIIGNCVVAAIGNEGNSRRHYHGNLLEEEYEDVEIRVGQGARGFTMELWGTTPDVLSVSFISPSGENVPRIPARVGLNDVINFLFEDTTIYLYYSLVESAAAAELVFMRFMDPSPGVWTVRIYGYNLLKGDFDLWMPIQQFINQDTYFLKPDPETTLTVPSPAQNVISVAGYNSSNNSLYTQSGRGYTRNGQVKPDIAAPAVNVYGPGINNDFVRRTGTSVSAALVAGNCAQMLEWGIVDGNEAYMGTNHIKNYLIRGAARDRNVVYPNPQWGYGRINVYESFTILTRS